MRVLFVYSNAKFFSLKKPLKSYKNIHVGISYISSVLKSQNHSTSVLALSSEMEEVSLDMVDKKIKEFEPQLICFTTVTTQYLFISRVASHIKNHWSSIFLFVGGAYVSLAPHNVLSDDFDALCIGEGEFPTAELVAQLEAGQYPSNILNLWIKRKDKTIEKNPTRPFMQNIDSLPFPDREMWKSLIDVKYNHKQFVFCARGCPFTCTYCANHALKKLASDKYVRFRSVENILKEISFLNKQYPKSRQIYFQAETFNLNRKWLLELCDRLESFNATLKEPYSYSCLVYVIEKFLNEEIFSAFQRANIVAISIGLESGNERIRKEVLKRYYSNEDFLKAVSLARSHGIKVSIFNLIGLPGETKKDHMETVRINNLARPDRSYQSVFIPYPGTDLYDVCKDQGLVKNHFGVTFERQKALVDMPGFAKKEIEHAYKWFEFRIYKGQKNLFSRLQYVFDRQALSNYTTHYVSSKIRRFHNRLKFKIVSWRKLN